MFINVLKFVSSQKFLRNFYRIVVALISTHFILLFHILVAAYFLCSFQNIKIVNTVLTGYYSLECPFTWSFFGQRNFPQNR